MSADRLCVLGCGFDTVVRICELSMMDSHQYPPIHTLSLEEQAAIDRQVSRIKMEFGFQQEMLSLDDLSKIIGKKINVCVRRSHLELA